MLLLSLWYIPQASADSVGELVCKIIDKNFEVTAGTMKEVLASKTRDEALRILRQSGEISRSGLATLGSTGSASGAMGMLRSAAAHEAHEWETKARRDFSSLADDGKASVGRFLLATDSKDKVQQMVSGAGTLSTEKLSTTRRIKGEIKPIYRTRLDSGNSVRYYVDDGRPHIIAVD